MNNFLLMVEVISAISVLSGIIIPVFIWVHRLVDGQKCQLRGDMLRIYYHSKDNKKVRQYEMENFMLMYKAYKALKGNSFIDKIYKELIEWEVEK